jgi:small GTP-binding protein
MFKKKLDLKNEQIKVVLLGNVGVGKTAILQRLDEKPFQDLIISTFNPSYIVKEMNINGKKIELEVWDTAGQEQYKALSKLYIKNAKIAVLVYDITRKETLIDLDFWFKFIDEELGTRITLGLAGNKTDLFTEEKVSKKEGKEYAENWGAVFSLLSAKKDKAGIDVFFENLVKKYLESQNDEIPDSIIDNRGIRITESDIFITEEKSSCCGGGKNKKEKGIKIAFLGSNKVGKTSIINSLKGKGINKKYEHTKKIVKKKITFTIRDKKKINVNLIDTNGNDCNNKELEIILEECKIIFLVFNLNERNSFEELKDLMKKISNHKDNIKYFGILGNKTNLSDEECISKEEVEEFTKIHEGHYLPIDINDISNLRELIKNAIEN